MKGMIAKRGFNLILAGLLALPAGSATALAAPAIQALPTVEAVPQQAQLQEAGWRDRHRHGRWRHRHRHRHWDDDGINPGAAIALGVIGSLIASGMSRSAAYDAIERCDARFRSFERDTGLYTTYGGDKRLCPYLR